MHTVKQNTKASIVVSKEIGLEINTDKSKYMVMSRDQNAGPNHSMKIDNNSFEKVEEFKFWNNFNKSKFCSGRNQEQTEIRECLLSFGAEYFVFQFAIQKFKD